MEPVDSHTRVWDPRAALHKLAKKIRTRPDYEEGPSGVSGDSSPLEGAQGETAATSEQTGAAGTDAEQGATGKQGESYGHPPRPMRPKPPDPPKPMVENVVVDPLSGKQYAVVSGGELFPRVPDPPKPKPHVYDPKAVMQALYPLKDRRMRLDEEIAVIVTFVEPDAWSGDIFWRIARMRRWVYHHLKSGEQIPCNSFVYEGRAQKIDLGGPNASTASESGRKREKKEVKRLSKLFGMPYLLRYREKTVSNSYGELQS